MSGYGMQIIEGIALAVLLGIILYNPTGFSTVVGAGATTYQNFVKTLQGR